MNPEVSSVRAAAWRDTEDAAHIWLADGRSAQEVFDEELEADKQVEWNMLIKELMAVAIVAAVVIARQLWFI